MKNVTARVVVVASALAGTCTAQGRYISYPQDTTTYSTVAFTTPEAQVPLGVFAYWLPPTDESRWQQIIPNEYLPTMPGTILGLSVVCSSAANFSGLSYGWLRVRLSATSATALLPSFDNNLNAPATALTLAPGSVGWPTGTWTYLPFATPVAHDGRTSLVLEFQKEARPPMKGWIAHALPVNPDRLTLPRAIYAAGARASGAAHASVAQSTAPPLQVRLHFDGLATLSIRSDRLGGNGNAFAIGGAVDVCVHGTALSPCQVWVAGGFVPRFAIPGVLGEGLVPLSVFLSGGTIGLTGSHCRNVPIPPNARLIGGRLTLQAVVHDARSSRLMFTNATDLVVSP